MEFVSEFSSDGLKAYRKDQLNAVSQLRTIVPEIGAFQTLTDRLHIGFLAIVRKQLSGEIE
jgi:hypothetical protein